VGVVGPVVRRLGLPGLRPGAVEVHLAVFAGQVIPVRWPARQGHRSLREVVQGIDMGGRSGAAQRPGALSGW
jgi:hypothetical protein